MAANNRPRVPLSDAESVVDDLFEAADEILIQQAKQQPRLAVVIDEEGPDAYAYIDALMGKRRKIALPPPTAEEIKKRDPYGMDLHGLMLTKNATRRSIEECRRIRAKQRDFLAHYLATFEPIRAAIAVGVNEYEVEKWHRQPAFEQMYQQIRLIVYERLEATAIKRAHSGSDRLLVKLLEAYVPEKFGRVSTNRMIGTGPNGEIEVNVNNWAELARRAQVTHGPVIDVNGRELDNTDTTPVVIPSASEKAPIDTFKTKKYTRKKAQVPGDTPAEAHGQAMRDVPVDGKDPADEGGRVLQERSGERGGEPDAPRKREPHVPPVE